MNKQNFIRLGCAISLLSGTMILSAVPARAAQETFITPEAAVAARQHIIADLREEGWTEQDHFPRDEADYKRMGLF